MASDGGYDFLTRLNPYATAILSTYGDFLSISTCDFGHERLRQQFAVPAVYAASRSTSPTIAANWHHGTSFNTGMELT